MLSTFPSSGAPSRVLTTAYENPRVLYLTEWMLWTSVAILRWFLWLKDFRIILIWGCVDTFLVLANSLLIFFVNSCCHHRQRYLAAKTKELSAEQVTHCLAILHYKEPEYQLYNLVRELAQQYTEGKKVLIIGMEDGTSNKTDKLQKIEELWGGSFDTILYTIHVLRPGEVPGTCSNHFEVQVAADVYFADKTNVIMSKFDCNMRISGELLCEIETHWCSLDIDRRHSVTFMPNVCWSADVPDNSRSLWEISTALAMCGTGNAMPFPMSFGSGSLAGAIEAGYTPHSLLAEDELMYSKKAVLLKDAHTCRLSSTVMKVFYPQEVSSKTFVTDIYLPKVERWWLGWLEVHGYLLSWLFGRLKDHPPVRSSTKTVSVIFVSVMRMYIAFVSSLGLLPSSAVGFFGWRDYSQDRMCYILLVSQLIAVVLYYLVSVLSLVMIWRRLYNSFDFLKLSWKKLPAAMICGLPLSAMIPLRILWTFFEHGLLNRPVAHMANMHFEPAYEPEEEPEAPGLLEVGSHSKRLLSSARDDSTGSAAKCWSNSIWKDDQLWKEDPQKTKYEYQILVTQGDSESSEAMVTV